MLTCRHFYSLLTIHGLIIVRAVVSSTERSERIILGNLAKTTTKWSPFAWLDSGHRMNATIDRLLFHLERAGALQDENHIFREGTTDQDPSHARRIVRTILIALQTITMQGTWEQRCDYVMKKPPDLINSFASHVKALVRFLICNAYLYIQDLDADMNGTAGYDLPFSAGLYEDFCNILREATLFMGPSLLLRLVEMKPKFGNAEQFLRWLWNLYYQRERRYGWIPDMEFHLEDLSDWIDLEHEDRWCGAHNIFGIKYAGDMDLTKWTKVIPNEEAWEILMCLLGWFDAERYVKERMALLSQN